MKAIAQDRYGPIDGLRVTELDRPAVGPREVLVRVRAAAVHVGDCFSVLGSPWPVRLVTGLRRPRYGVPGLDLAGEVVEVGAAVTRFRSGDLVFGAGIGTCAEYARASEATLAAKPAALSFEEAAALTTSGLAALHGIRDVGRVRPGQRVLINGAAGGVGTFAVQIAKSLGAEVTGVCGPSNVELLRSLGADQVIDHTREDFTRSDRRYDIILDNIENRPVSEVRRALTPDGTLVLNSGTGSAGLAFLVKLVAPLLLGRFVRHSIRRYFSNPNVADLAFLSGLAVEGQLRPVIGATYPLAETPAALGHIATGHARGKVVVAVAGG